MSYALLFYSLVLLNAVAITAFVRWMWKRNSAVVHRGRYTALLKKRTKPFVVFLIGFRVNSWLGVLWHFASVRTFVQLAFDVFQFGKSRANAEHGCLGEQVIGNPITGSVSVQYWDSFEALQRFGTRHAAHSKAWQQFYADVDRSGVIGIWHEAYEVDPRRGAYENVYGNMPHILMSSLPSDTVEVVQVSKQHLNSGKARQGEVRRRSAIGEGQDQEKLE